MLRVSSISSNTSSNSFQANTLLPMLLYIEFFVNPTNLSNCPPTKGLYLNGVSIWFLHVLRICAQFNFSQLSLWNLQLQWSSWHNQSRWFVVLQLKSLSDCMNSFALCCFNACRWIAPVKLHENNKVYVFPSLVGEML